MDGGGPISGRGKRFFSFLTSRPPLRATQPPIEWVPGALAPGVRRPGREAVHSSPSSDEVKNGGTISPVP
jgi:hypothetical protein